MSDANDAGRGRRAAWTTAGGGLAVVAMMAWATVPSEGWTAMVPLVPIGFFAGAIVGGLFAGTTWYSGVE